MGPALVREVDRSEADVADPVERPTDLSGCDLTACLNLAQAQIDAATGDAATTLPPGLRRPAHWR